MALAMREHLAPVRDRWRAQLVALEVGIGIAQGEATLALLSCAGRVDYTILGPVMDQAEGLCDAAPPGQILLTAAMGPRSPGWSTLPRWPPSPGREAPHLGGVMQVCDGRPARG
jgi:class 3 adenylate cyclase